MKNYIKISDSLYEEIVLGTRRYKDYTIVLSGEDDFSIYSVGGTFVGLLKEIEGKLSVVSGKSNRILTSLNDVQILSIRDNKTSNLLSPKRSLMYKGNDGGYKFYPFVEEMKKEDDLEEVILWV